MVKLFSRDEHVPTNKDIVNNFKTLSCKSLSNWGNDKNEE